MTTIKDNKDFIPPTLRNASDPFKIYFTEEPYFLTVDQLMEQAESPMRDKRRWSYPQLKFISFENRILKLEISTLKRSTYCLTIEVDPDCIHVSCNCGMSVEKLCVHALKGLENIVDFRWNEEWYFERYRPGGAIDTGLRHPDFFKKEVESIHCHFLPKKHAGGVYAFSNEINLTAFNHIMDLPGPSEIVLPEVNTVMTYMVIYAYGYRMKMPPFIVPCLGVLKKSRDGVKSFEQFRSGTDKDYERYLTENEKSLNILCREMWQSAENSSQKLLNDDEGNHLELKKLFSLWEEALPYLCQQDYVYSQLLFHICDLKGRPIKRLAHWMTIGKERPVLSFKLADKGAYYQLDLKLSLGNKVISLVNRNMMLFVYYDGIDYLVASLRDVAVLEWMEKVNNSLVIFKEHFEQFEQLYLNFLKQNYPVKTN